jgi:hypothetical protein
MGFIHHTTGATKATGLMDDAVRLQGCVRFAHHAPLATDFLCLLISAARVGDYHGYLRLRRAPNQRLQAIDTRVRATPAILPLRCCAERAYDATEPQSGHEAAGPRPPTRFHVVKGQDH